MFKLKYKNQTISIQNITIMPVKHSKATSRLCSIVGLLGAFFIAIGSSLAQASNSVPTGISIMWISALYSAILYGWIMYQSFQEYEFVTGSLIGFISILMAYSPVMLNRSMISLNSVLILNSGKSSLISAGYGFIACGFLLVLIPTYILMLTFGSKVDSIANQIFRLVDDLFTVYVVDDHDEGVVNDKTLNTFLK